jgi:hypothetical protein
MFVAGVRLLLNSFSTPAIEMKLKEQKISDQIAVDSLGIVCVGGHAQSE